jgi:chromosomal replication initiator protein
MDVVSAIQRELCDRIGRERYGLWFREGVRLGCEGDALVVAASGQFLLDRLRKQFARELQALSLQFLGDAATVRYVVAPQSLPTNPDGNGNGTTGAGPIRTVPGVKPAPAAAARPSGARFARLDDFVIGDANRVAATAARSVLQRPGTVSPLFVHGPTGCGKTQLLEGIWSEFRARTGLTKVLLLAAEQFTTHFLEALRGSGLPSFRRKVRELDVLLLDDLQFFPGKRATIVELQNTVDCLLRQGRQLVLTADRPPHALKGLGPEFVGRVSGGLVCPLDAPDFATRLGIARRMAANLQTPVPHDVLELIAGKLQGDARQISGALNRLRATSDALQQPITYELALTALEDIFRATQRLVHLPDIERAVCEVFGLDARSLRDGRKARTISQPRMLAMWLARKYTRAAFSEISEYFGRRSHSTVISAEKKVNGWMAKGATVQLGLSECRVEEAIRRVETQLRAG